MADAKSLQVDHYGRIVNISSEDLISGMNANTTPTGTGSSAAGKMASIALDERAKKDLIDDLVKELKGSFVDPQEVKKAMDHIETIVKFMQQMDAKKKASRKSGGGGSSSSPDASLKNAHEKMWTGARVSALDKFIREGLYGRSIHVQDITVANLLTGIARDIGNMSSGKGGGRGRSRAAMEPPYAPGSPAPATSKSDVDDHVKSVLGQHAHAAADNMDSLDETAAAATDSMKDLEDQTEDTKLAMSILKRVLLGNSKSLRTFKEDISNLSKRFHELGLSGEQMRDIAQAARDSRSMDKADRKLLIGTLQKLEKISTKGGSKEDLQAQAQKLAGVSKSLTTKDDKLTSKLGDVADSLAKVGHRLAFFSPSNLGLGPEMAFASPGKGIQDVTKSAADWSKDAHASMYAAFGTTGSAIDKGTSELQKRFHDMGTDLEDMRIQTGAMSDVVRKQLVKNFRMGVTEMTRLERVTRHGLALGKIIGADAEATADELASWNMHMHMTNEQTAKLSLHIQSVARSTGVTGDNLLQAVKHAKAFADNMRAAGTFTDKAAKMFISMSASAKKFGVESQIGAIQEALSSREGFLNSSLMPLLAQAGQSRGGAGLQALMQGQVGNTPGAMKEIIAGLEDVANRFGDAEELMKRANAGDIEARNLVAARQTEISKLTGGKLQGLGDLVNAIKALKDSNMTVDERIEKIQKELQGPMAARQRESLQATLKELEAQKSRESVGSAAMALNEIAENIKKKGTLGDATGDQQKALKDYQFMLKDMLKKVRSPERRQGEDDRSFAHRIAVAKLQEDKIKDIINKLEQVPKAEQDVLNMIDEAQTALTEPAIAERDAGLDHFTSLNTQLEVTAEKVKSLGESAAKAAITMSGVDKAAEVSVGTDVAKGLWSTASSIIGTVKDIGLAYASLRLMFGGGSAAATGGTAATTGSGLTAAGVAKTAGMAYGMSLAWTAPGMMESAKTGAVGNDQFQKNEADKKKFAEQNAKLGKEIQNKSLSTMEAQLKALDQKDEDIEKARKAAEAYTGSFTSGVRHHSERIFGTLTGNLFTDAGVFNSAGTGESKFAWSQQERYKTMKGSTGEERAILEKEIKRRKEIKDQIRTAMNAPKGAKESDAAFRVRQRFGLSGSDALIDDITKNWSVYKDIDSALWGGDPETAMKLVKENKGIVNPATIEAIFNRYQQKVPEGLVPAAPAAAPVAKPTSAPGMEEAVRAEKAKSDTATAITAPLSEANAHLSSIKESNSSVKAETTRMRESIDRLVAIFTPKAASGDTGTKQVASSPPNFFNAPVPITTNPNMGATRPNGVTT